MEHEATLLAIAKAVFEAEPNQLAEVRASASKVIGPQAVSDAIAVACGFNGITKIANATGLPLDAGTAKSTVEMNQTTGIEAYAEAHKAAKYD